MAELTETIIRQRLLGPTGHLYWDLVYSTDAAGRYQRADVHGRYPAACLRFAAPNQLLHYSNLDSVRVRDAGCHLGIVFNPGTFTLAGDTLTWFSDNKSPMTTPNAATPLSATSPPITSKPPCKSRPNCVRLS